MSPRASSRQTRPQRNCGSLSVRIFERFLDVNGVSSLIVERPIHSVEDIRGRDGASFHPRPIGSRNAVGWSEFGYSNRRLRIPKLAPVADTRCEIRVQEGGVAAVGDVLAVIDERD